MDMWYDYCENSTAVTSVYKHVPSLDAFLLFEIQWQPSSSVMLLRGDLSSFPDASQYWTAPYNTAQIRLEFNEVVILEMSINDPAFDLVVKVTIEQHNSSTLLLQVLSQQCKIRAYANKAKIISLTKYVSLLQNSDKSSS